MADQYSTNIGGMVRGYRELYRKLPGKAGALAVEQFKGTFRSQGWTVNGMVLPWPKRARADRNKSKRALLIQSGRLRRSIRIVARGVDFVSIGTDVPYAQIHNEGGTISGSAEVKQHSRRAHRRGRTQVKEHEVKAHNRTVNTKIPKRKFIGHSLDVLNKLDRWIGEEIDRIAKQT